MNGLEAFSELTLDVHTHCVCVLHSLSPITANTLQQQLTRSSNILELSPLQVAQLPGSLCEMSFLPISELCQLPVLFRRACFSSNYFSNWPRHDATDFLFPVLDRLIQNATWSWDDMLPTANLQTVPVNVGTIANGHGHFFCFLRHWDEAICSVQMTWWQ